MLHSSTCTEIKSVITAIELQDETADFDQVNSIS